jgi:hypothetical protein
MNVESTGSRGGRKKLLMLQRAPLDPAEGGIESLRQLAEASSLPTPVSLSDRFAVFGAELCSSRPADTRSRMQLRSNSAKAESI